MDDLSVNSNQNTFLVRKQANVGSMVTGGVIAGLGALLVLADGPLPFTDLPGIGLISSGSALFHKGMPQTLTVQKETSEKNLDCNY